MRKWIGYYENVISGEAIKEIFNYPWHWSPSTYSSHKGQSHNSEERVRMDEVWVREENRPYPNLREAVLKSMRFYGEEHENFSCIHHTDFRINRYGIDGFMSSHIDNIHHSHGQQYGYPQVSVLLFLNDDYEGGEFHFFDGKVIEPKAGKLIIHPTFAGHGVKPVTKGHRYSCVAWGVGDTFV